MDPRPARPAHVPAGDTLLAEGDAPTEIYVIEEGEVDVVMSDGRGTEHP